MHPTERFYEHLDILLDALEGDTGKFERDLANALKTLESYDWTSDQNPTPLRPHGHSGRDFSYPIDAEFLLIVRRDTDRVGHKPQLIHLYLKTIERAKQ